MASDMPIPAPPRTPSPISSDDGLEDESHPRQYLQTPANGLGLGIEALLSPTRVSFDPKALSPMSEFVASRYDTSTLYTPTSATRFPATTSSLSPLSAERSDDMSTPDTGNDSVGFRNPFNFQPMAYTAGKTPGRSNVGQRRGHKYKHSSVSHQIFLEPPSRAPLRLPASLPIPTTKEGWKSTSREQRIRVGWCFCHLFVAGFVQWTTQGSLAITALSHLIFYDAIGAFLCAGVEILSNFEVWKRSSIRQPFGLERSEVLVGFAMSILLLFMGFDLLSHNISHVLEDIGDHEAHHDHAHSRISSRNVVLVSILAVASTLVSALMLQNHARIAKSMHFGSISFLPSVLNNPSHLLTLSCSGFLLLMPILSFDSYTWLDRGLSTAIALFMCLLGFQLVKTLGAMLLMSYSGDGIAELLRDIETDPTVKSVEEAKFWQVHYGLCMANLKLRVRGTEESLAKLRERVTSLIHKQLGNGGNQLWEVSTQFIIEKE